MTHISHILEEIPVDNSAVIAEEELGTAHALMQYHVTVLQDQEVMRKIREMSILEVIN